MRLALYKACASSKRAAERSVAFIIRLRGAQANIATVVADAPPLPSGVDGVVTVVTNPSVPSTAIAAALRGLADRLDLEAERIERAPWGAA